MPKHNVKLKPKPNRSRTQAYIRTNSCIEKYLIRLLITSCTLHQLTWPVQSQNRKIREIHVLYCIKFFDCMSFRTAKIDTNVHHTVCGCQGTSTRFPSINRLQSRNFLDSFPRFVALTWSRNQSNSCLCDLSSILPYLLYCTALRVDVNQSVNKTQC